MIVIGALLLLIALAVAFLLVFKSAPSSSRAAIAAVGGKSDLQPIFVLGDSFAQNAVFEDQFSRAFAGRQVVIDGVGSSSLEDQRKRFDGRIEGWKSLLIILDGGLNDSNAVRPVEAIVGQLDPGCGRWLYVEPLHTVESGPIGSPAYRQQTAAVEAVRKRWPNHFVPMIDAMRKGAGPSPEDQASVAGGWTPASLRQPDDPLHLNAEGYRILIQTVQQAVAKLDASPSGLCSGATMEQMQASMNRP